MNVFAIQPQEDIMAPRSGPTIAGTRNFVIFDDSLVDITHVDGSPVTRAERKAAIKAMQL